MDQYIKTKNSSVRIYDINHYNNLIRLMDVNGGHQSACYIEDSQKSKLVVDYTKFYNLMFHVTTCKNVLMIGGGGFSYPKFLVSNFPDIEIDVIEIDEEITEIAKKYMFLQDYLDKYNTDNCERLRIINDDGRNYISNCTRKYDAILNDAYDGDKPIQSLLTVEFLQKLKNRLNPNGVYITNIISSLEGENSKTLKDEVKTLKCLFKNVFVIPCSKKYSVYSKANNIVLSTDRKIDFENKYIFSDTKDAEIIKD